MQHTTNMHPLSSNSLLIFIASAFLFLPISFTYSETSVPELISDLLNDEILLNCEVMFVQTEINSESTFDSNSTLTEDMHNPLPLPKFNLYSTSSGTFTVNIGQNNITEKNLVYRRLQDIHRFNSKHCGVAVMYISQILPDLSKRLFKTIIPRYLPIIRKDEDHFVFVFNNDEDANEILLSPEFGNKIKFKIGIIRPTELSLQPEIKQVDMYGENGKCVVQTLPLTLSGTDSLFLDKNNFNGKLFQVVNPKAPSYFEMEPEGNGKQTYRPVRGLYKKWLDVMMERFNFTIELHSSSASGSTGKRLKNGTWIGSVGDILSGRADMASFNGHIHNRHQFVDWSAPLTYEWMVFITHKQKSFFSPSAIYRPFPISLWVGFVASVVIICVTFKLISKFASQSYLPIDLKGMIMFIFSSFMEQDAQFYLEILHLHSVRVLTSFWFLFALVISTAYRGKLVSLIAFPALSWVPTTFDELAYSNYRVGLNVFGKGGATYTVLSTSKSPVYQTFFKRMELYPNPVHCLNEAFHNDFGCLMVKSVADFFGAKNFTDKFGRNPFKASEQTALFREDGYVSWSVIK